MQNAPKIKESLQLTKKQIQGYRQWLSELDEEAREPGGNLLVCDPEVWQCFNPHKSTGYQVYMSYSDEELLDVLLKTMDRPGHNPDYSDLYCVYKQYLRCRFGSFGTAKKQAKVRMKRLSAPVIKCKKTPVKKCRFATEKM